AQVPGKPGPGRCSRCRCRVSLTGKQRATGQSAGQQAAPSGQELSAVNGGIVEGHLHARLLRKRGIRVNRIDSAALYDGVTRKQASKIVFLVNFCKKEAGLKPRKNARYKRSFSSVR